jgi:pre-mRNA-splicing factor CWC22
LFYLLEDPTEDSVDIACDFMIECGQIMTDLCSSGVNAVFERFKGILHEGEIDKKVQYSIENLFAVRKNKFADHPGVIPELDLVEDEDKILHHPELDEELLGEDFLNIFIYDPHYEKTEEEWQEIKYEILGEDNIIRLKTAKFDQIDLKEGDSDLEDDTEEIRDMTDTDLLRLREAIYLVIMNSIDFEECAHKLLKMNIGQGHEGELCNMISDCCMQERTYTKFYGL